MTKEADNRIIEKTEINEIENKIYAKKNELKKNEINRENYINCHKLIGNCLDLLSSVKQSESRHKYEEMHLKNNLILKNMSQILDEKQENINKNIHDLYEQKLEMEKNKRIEQKDDNGSDLDASDTDKTKQNP